MRSGAAIAKQNLLRSQCHAYVLSTTGSQQDAKQLQCEVEAQHCLESRVLRLTSESTKTSMLTPGQTKPFLKKVVT